MFAGAAWALEEIRSRIVHRRPILTDPRVVLGDSSAGLLVKYAEMTAVHLLSPEPQEGLTGIVRSFDGVVPSSKVKALLIVLGRDALIGNEPMDTIEEHLLRLRALCERYHHLVIYWCVPPFVYKRKLQYNEFVRRLAKVLQNSQNITFGFVAPEGRSLAEVFRYGGTYAGSRVNQTGILTEQGARAMLAWITQIGGFPGERALGQPRLRSQVVCVRPDPTAASRVRLGSDQQRGQPEERRSRRDDDRRRVEPIRRSSDSHSRFHRPDPDRRIHSAASWRRPGSSSSSRPSSSRRPFQPFRR